MKAKEKLLIITVALVVGAMLGLLFRNWAAWAGSTFVLFALLYAGYWRYENWKSKRETGYEPEAETAEESGSNATAEAYNPGLGGGLDESFLSKEKTIEYFSSEFGIPWQKAKNLYYAGYTRTGDFSEAIPSDLMMVDGINPTLARKIISKVNSGEMKGT